MFSEKVPEEKENLWIVCQRMISRDPNAGGHRVHCRKYRKLPASEARREGGVGLRSDDLLCLGCLNRVC